jgi:diguanylate cyclase (GGDEF)-like protein
VESLDTTPLAMLDSGESVGELSIVDGMPTTAYVVADDDCELLVVQENILWDMLHVSHEMSINLMILMSRRLRDHYSAYTQSMRKEKEYKRSASIDDLTGIYNRRWFRDMLNNHMQRSVFSGDPLCLMMMDIDHFKQFNDKHGHLAGDHVLKTVAGIMRDKLKPAGLVARYGGEEFIALLPDTDIQHAHRLADKTRRAIRQTSFTMENGIVLPRVTLSIGLVEMHPPESIDDFIQRADELLYRAKDEGRDRVESSQLA